jgi:outer membrane protein assembly factor BamB
MEPLEDRCLLAVGDLVQTITDPDAPPVQPCSEFGFAVAVDGDLVVVGTPYAETYGPGGLGYENEGPAYVFNSSTGALVSTLPNSGQLFGYSVAISGNTVVGGSPDSNSASIFDATTGNRLKSLSNPTPADGDGFGYSVAVSGTTVVVGAYCDDTGATDSGSAYVFDAATGSLLKTLNNPAPATGANFGRSVAISGGKVVVGAYYVDSYHTSRGSAYVFDATTGSLLKTFATPAYSVAISGNAVVVGAPGSAKLYSAFTGALMQTLTNPASSSANRFGNSVAISGSTVVVGASYDDTGATAAGSAYVFDAATGGLLAAIHNPAAAAGDQFAASVAISGSTVVMGTPFDDAGSTDSGSAYVFDAAGNLLDTLTNPTPPVSECFGYSMALSDGNLVVGEAWNGAGAMDSNSLYVFDAATGSMRTTIESPTPGRPFGYSVAVSGNTVLEGSAGNDSAYVYDATTGDLLRTLDNPTPSAMYEYGGAVAISGTVAVVGASYMWSSAWANAVYVFDITTGRLLSTLNNPTPATADHFGGSVAISGNTVLVSDSGCAYVFDATTGTLLRTLTSPSPGGADRFAWSVGLSGNVAVVGAYRDNTAATNSGSAYVFDVTTGNLLWTLNNPTPAEYDNFGRSVAISGRTVVVGASGDDTGATGSGSAYVFDAASGNLLATLNNPTPANARAFGTSVAAWGGTAVVGAPGQNQATTNQGAAYVFRASPVDTLVSSVSGRLLIEDTVAHDDNITVSLDAGSAPHALVIYEAGSILVTDISGAVGIGTDTLRVPVTAFGGQVDVHSHGGNDSLTVDFSGGNLIFNAGLAYDGGTNGLAGDALRIVGTSIQEIVYRPDATMVGKGTIDLVGSTGGISFTGIEPLAVSNMQSVTLVSPNGPDNLTLSPDTIGGTSATRVTGTSGSLSMERISICDVPRLVLDLEADPQADADHVRLTGTQLARGLNSVNIAMGGGTNDVEVPGTVDLGPTGQLLITGDPAAITLSSGSITAAALQFPAGTRIMGTGTLNAALAGATRIEATGPLSLGTGGTSGFNFDGTLVVGSNTVTLNSASLARLGTLTTINGGTLVAVNGISLLGGVLQGSGAVNGRVSASFGSTIQATGDLVLGDSNSYAGFASDGELYVGAHTVTLYDRDVARLGTLTSLGSGGSPGTLNASNSLVVDFGNTLAGTGTVNTPNQAAKALVNNGNIVGDSVSAPVTLSGYIKGAGTFDNIQFTGTYSPGLSPTQQQVGSLALSNTSTLVMELGGTQAGSHYDQLVNSGTVQLDGTLQVVLTDGFLPTIGDHFTIVSPSGGGTIAGTFDTISVPGLPADCTWHVAESASGAALTVVAMKVDADGNGRADALTDGILILRYLFDPAGQWNYADAQGSGAARTTRTTIRTFLDGGKDTVLDVDGNGTPDALTDGILILRYLFDPAGQWNYSDALGSGATRTTRVQIKAYLDQYNPSPSPAPPMITAVMPAENLWTRPEATPANSTTLAVGATIQMDSNAEPASRSNFSQVQTAVSRALMIGDTGSRPITVSDQGAMSNQADESHAVDLALESVDQSPIYDLTWVPIQSPSETSSNDEKADQPWRDAGLDWYLPHPGDLVNDQEFDELILSSL